MLLNSTELDFEIRKQLFKGHFFINYENLNLEVESESFVKGKNLQSVRAIF